MDVAGTTPGAGSSFTQAGNVVTPAPDPANTPASPADPQGCASIMVGQKDFTAGTPALTDA